MERYRTVGTLPYHFLPDLYCKSSSKSLKVKQVEKIFSRLQITRASPLNLPYIQLKRKLNPTMVTMVISLNIALAIFCLGAAWKLYQVRRTLRRVTRWLILAERNTDRVLYRAPYYILLGQSGIKYERGQMVRLGALKQQIVRVSALLKLLQWVRQSQVQPLQGRLTSRTKRPN